MKKRTTEPWKTAEEYGRGLPAFTVNLIVRDVARSVAFYRDVLAAQVHYSDGDFAALRAGELEFCIHADHTYEHHAWQRQFRMGESRGVGAELRLMGLAPEVVEVRAREHGAIVMQGTMEKPHGWRDVVVADPDGYVWAIGVKT